MKIGLFVDLDHNQLRRIAAYATELSVAAGERIIRKDDWSYELLAIEEGSAEVWRDGILVATLGPGEIVGELGVLDGGLRSATVIAIEPMRLIKLSRWDVRRLRRIAPAAIDSIERIAASRRHASG
jgi:CRP-like cAMP-binding protein